MRTGWSAKMHLEIKYLITILSVILIFGGLYFKFMYDVPDGGEITNMWVSWFLIIFGIVGIIVSTSWKKRNPLYVANGDDSEEQEDKDYFGSQDARPSNISSKNKSYDIGDHDHLDAGDTND